MIETLPQSSQLLVLQQSNKLIGSDLQLLRPKLEALSYPEIAGVHLERVNPYVYAVDLRPILQRHHPQWRGELIEVAREAQERKIIGGSVPTSLEPGDHVTYYQPTNGQAIRESLPWLHDLFRKEIRYLVERVTGDFTMQLGEDSSALNMNYLREGPYERHIDRNPCTALLGVTDVQDREGGELIVHEGLDPITNQPFGRSYKIRPQAGILYLFGGLKHPHEVTDYHGKAPRLVVPGDYYSKQVPEVVDTRFNQVIGV